MGNKPPRFFTHFSRTIEKKVFGVKNREDSEYVSEAEKRRIREQREAAQRRTREAQRKENERKAKLKAEKQQIQTETAKTTSHSQSLATQKQQHTQAVNALNSQISQLQTQVSTEKKKAVKNEKKIHELESTHQTKVQEYETAQAQLQNTLADERVTNQKIRMQELQEHLMTINYTIEGLESHLEEKQQALNDQQFEFEMLEKVLAGEEAAAQEAKLVNLDEADETIQNAKRVVLLGNTGDGKSTLGNRLCGDDSRRGDQGPFVTSARGRSETQEVSWHQTENGFLIFDTPGRGDTNGKDRLHATNFVLALRGIGCVHAFIIVRNVTNARVSDPDKGILREIARLLGETFWKNVIMVFVRVDDEDEEKYEFEPRQEEIPIILEQDLGVNVPIEMFGIGKANFSVKRDEILDAVMRCNDGNPFVSDALKSPLEERREEVRQDLQKLESLRMDIDDILRSLENEQQKKLQVETELRGLN